MASPGLSSLGDVEAPPLAAPASDLRAATRWFEASCAWASVMLPLGLTLVRVSSVASWRGDVAVVRSLGMMPVGLEGALSSVLCQLTSLIPVGGRHLRVGLLSAVALAVAARIIYALARRLLASSGFSPRLGPALALAAALLTTLSVTWQLEGTIGGGATVAAALGLGALLVRPDRQRVDFRIWLGFGGLVALALAESHVAGAFAFMALAVQAVVLRDLPERRAALFGALGFLAVLAACLVPLLVRPYAARAGMQVASGLVETSIAGIDASTVRLGALMAWRGDMGWISLGLAGFGAAVGVLRERSRWLVAPLVTLVLADVLLPAQLGSPFTADPLMPLRLMALGAVAILMALGVQAGVMALSHARIPLARPAAALIGLFTFALVLMASERASHVADRRGQLATEAWTDHALGRLPYGSVLLVRSPAAAWRLLAARVVRGERPDILIVPLGMLDRGSVARELLRAEPGLTPLLRDVAVSGVPGEYALSSLSDLRPLYVELDPSWGARLVDHLMPESFWLSFAPTAMGRSDRSAALARSRRAFAEVRELGSRPGAEDDATLAMLQVRAREQLVALAALNDKEEVRRLTADLRELDPQDPLVLRMEKQLSTHKRRRLDVSHLLGQR